MAENIIDFWFIVLKILKVYKGGGVAWRREKNLHTKRPDDDDLDINTPSKEATKQPCTGSILDLCLFHPE